MLVIQSPCRENAIAVFHKDALYVWGGRYERSWDHFSEFEAQPHDCMWRYDLIQGHWEQYGTFPSQLHRRLASDRTGHSAVVYNDKIWIFGGLSGNQSTYYSELFTFDTIKREWEVQTTNFIGPAVTGRGWHQAVVYNDNMVVYGHNGDCMQQAQNPECVFTFNFSSSSWSMERCSTRAGKASERPFHDGVLAMTVYNDKIYVLSCDLRVQGGAGNVNVQDQLAAFGFPVADNVVIHGQQYQAQYVVANAAPAQVSTQLEIHELDFDQKTWRRISPQGRAPASRFGCAAVHVGDIWLVHGGLLADHTVSKQVFTYDFKTNEWSCWDKLTDTLVPRVSHKAVAVRDSVWLMMGTGQYNGGMRAGPFNYLDMLQGAPYVQQIDCIWLKARSPAVSKDNHIINTDIERGLKQLSQGDDLSDLVLRCTDGEFRAHRAILAANSEIFRAMFQHGMIETQDQCVHIEDASSETVRVMLSYMYGGMSFGEGLSDSLLVPTFKLADKYHVTGLRDACLSRIMRQLKLEELCQFVQLASAHHCNELYNACVQAAGQTSDTLIRMLEGVGYLQLSQEEPELMQTFMLDVVNILQSQKRSSDQQSLTNCKSNSDMDQIDDNSRQ
eukprot:TRINITY_DN9052_c1_g2_i1.p1 TRINITY_DN9052_c1_g2~~TRINITY_DN9052_c1_g2_i1.p1  ORF type:complete len:705 (-),score=87.47 TRINITY_DN9052_c1_g2_i1:281-2119(-)